MLWHHNHIIEQSDARWKIEHMSLPLSVENWGKNQCVGSIFRNQLHFLLIVSWKLSMWCCTIMLIVRITQPSVSPSPNLPSLNCFSSSLTFSSSFQLFEGEGFCWLYWIALNKFSNLCTGFLVVNPAFLSCSICSCTCLIAMSASSTQLLAAAISLSI